MTPSKPAAKKKASTKKASTKKAATRTPGAPEKAPARKPGTARKPAARKPSARKAPAKPPAAKDPPAKKAPARPSAAKKPAAKKSGPRRAGGVRNPAAEALEVEATFSTWITVDVRLLWKGAPWWLRVETNEPMRPAPGAGAETPLERALEARKRPTAPFLAWRRGWRAGPVRPDGEPAAYRIRRSSGAEFQQSDGPDGAVPPSADFRGWTVGDAIADAAGYLEGSTLRRGTFRVDVRGGRQSSAVVRPLAIEAVCAAWGAGVPTQTEQRDER